ncbi:MAG: type II toxin-antitoxin system VapC family toxin [Lachnospiraceae bacterium]|nr:type II toxin-antitoxin system VapC family toxin [Lachnospiraceae bacterium]
MYYLDSNICIFFLNGKYRSIQEHLEGLKSDQIRIPAIVKAELLTGAYKSVRRERNMMLLNAFLKNFRIESFVDQMTYTYADIRSDLEKAGMRIGPNDLIIASTVLYNNGILVTNNIKEFERVKGLRVEDWTR